MATVKISKNLNNEINRVVKNFNQKVARLQKMDKYNLLYIPEKVSKAKLLNIGNKRDLRRELNALKRYSERGMESTIKNKNGVEMSKWELDTYLRNRNASLRKLKKEINEMEQTEVKVLGKGLNISLAKMGDSNFQAKMRAYNKLRNNNFNKINDKKDFNRLNRLAKIKAIDGREYSVKQNYIDALLKVGYDAEIPFNLTNNIEKNLLKLSNKQFLNLFNTDKGIQELMNYYAKYREALRKGRNPSYDLKDVVEMYSNINDNIREIMKNA